MLEGKEAQGNIGSVANYSVDVDGNIPTFGKTVAEIAVNPMNFSKDLIPAIPGALAVEAEGELKFRVKVDPVAFALAEIGKIHNGLADMVAAQIAKLRAGQTLDAHAQAAVDAHAAAAAPSA